MTSRKPSKSGASSGNRKKEEGNYYGMNEQQKSEVALRVAQEKGFNFSSIEQLRQEIQEFSIQINSQIRNARPEQYNTSPSQLNNWPTYEPGQEMSQTLDQEDIAQVPTNVIELPEFG
ncbi:MAG: hypothetical protein F6K24_39360 [Okeania sp. SIO2D1]|nr:hypothetical protein [Okeania sp. SIO2D1]